MRRFAVLLAVFITVLPVGSVAAQTIYDNGAVNPAGYVGNPDLSQALMYEGFVLTGSEQVGSINFWALQWHNATDNFSGSVYWTISSNNGGAVGSTLFSGLATTGTDLTRTVDGTLVSQNLPIYLHAISVDLALDAGSYYLGLHNGLLDNYTATGYYWLSTAANGTDPGRHTVLANNGLHFNPVEYAFYLGGAEGDTGTPTETVPEPATMTLIATGLIGMAAARRRRKA